MDRLYFIPAALLSPASNAIIGREERENKYGAAVEEIALRQAAVAAVTIIIFLFLCIYLPLLNINSFIFCGSMF